MVFAGIFPTDSSDYPSAPRRARQAALINDAAFNFEPDSSEALGFGYRCGFLGLLHMEIIQERLEREFNLDLITTAPSVVYNVYKIRRRDAAGREPGSPCANPQWIERIEEPHREDEHPRAGSEYVGAVHGALPGEARHARST